jgi:hypothetical protein
MKSAHTPGPWLVRFDEDRFDPSFSTLKIIDGRDESLNHMNGALSLAFINVSAFAPHMDEPLANAHLIAAAPDLLASLIELELMVAEMLPKHGPCGWGELALNQAREAIAKAKGNP